MRILAVESSCDETAIAIVEKTNSGQFKVLSSQVASQIETHQVFGGVVPEVAAREHYNALVPLFQNTLEAAGLRESELGAEIDAIAVTQGPGLIGALLVGISFAKGLALRFDKPLIPVNHVHAHIHGAFLGLDSLPTYPMLALVVSGGHTNLYLLKKPKDYLLVACTIDDACGECFDKVGKMIGLDYPSGARIEQLAKAGTPDLSTMPKLVPVKSRLEFSFSGLKTHMSKKFKAIDDPNSQETFDLLASFQETAFDLLLRKVVAVAEKYDNISGLVVAGGVAANKTFQRMADERLDFSLYFPKLAFCADNAAMIAANAFEEIDDHNLEVFKAPFDWDGYPRYEFAKYLRRDR